MHIKTGPRNNRTTQPQGRHFDHFRRNNRTPAITGQFLSDFHFAKNHLITVHVSGCCGGGVYVLTEGTVTTDESANNKACKALTSRAASCTAVLTSVSKIDPKPSAHCDTLTIGMVFGGDPGAPSFFRPRGFPRAPGGSPRQRL